MTNTIEQQVAEGVFDAFTIMFSEGMTAQDRQQIADYMPHIDVEGEPIGKILLGVMVAVKALYENLTGEEAPLTVVSGAMHSLAQQFEAHERGE